MEEQLPIRKKQLFETYSQSGSIPLIPGQPKPRRRLRLRLGAWRHESAMQLVPLKACWSTLGPLIP